MTSPEIIIVDKPKGISSFDVIRRLRRILNIRKMGFAGTLDPAATGLLIVGINAGTKKLTEYTELDKEYLVDILFGLKTDSADMDGKVIEEMKIENLSQEAVEKAVYEMVGRIEITIPKYSAVKIDGKKLYQYARAGIEIESPKREVEIFACDLLGFGKDDGKYYAKIRLHCQKGTYARSIAEEIGKKLGVPAVVSELRRSKVGQFDIKDAQTLEMIEKNFQKTE